MVGIHGWAAVRKAGLAATALIVACCAPAHAATRPDLFPTRLVYPAGSAQPGVLYTTRATIENLGSATAGRSTTAFYLSLDAKRSSGDVRVGRVATKAIAADHGVRVTRKFYLPANLAPGTYRVLVCADDAHKVRESREGNDCLASGPALTVRRAAAQASAQPTVHLDPPPPEEQATSPPVTSAQATPAAVSLNAPLDGAFVRNGATTLGGTASTHSLVTIQVFAGSSAAGAPAETLQALPAPDGAWSVQPSPTLPDGAYTARAEATGPLGDVAVSPARTFTVDTVAPAVSIALDPATPDGSGGAYAATPAVHVAASDASLRSFDCTVDGTPAMLTGAAQSAGGDLTVSGEGPHTVACTAADQAGWTGAATSSFTVRSAAPVVSLVQPADGLSTADATPSFAGAAGTARGDLPSVTVPIYRGSSATGTPVTTLTATASGGAWSATPATGLADGTYTARARQSNAAGDVGSSAAHTFTIDTRAPSPAVAHPAAGAALGTGTPILDGTAGTAAGDAATVTVNVYAGSGATGTPISAITAAVSGGSWSTTPAALADRSYTVQVTQSDAAGNTGTSTARTFTVDTAAPAVTLTSPSAGPANDSTPAFGGAAGTASGDSGTVTVKVYSGSSAAGPPVRTITAAASSGSWTATPSPGLPDGTYTAVAEQADATGNTGTSSARTFTVDTAAPAIALDHPAEGSATTNATPTFDGTAGTASGDGPAVTVRIYSGSAASGTAIRTLAATAGAGGAWSATPSSALAEGIYTAQAEQADGAGNTGRSTAHTFTVGTPAPVVSIAHPAAGSTANDQYPTFDGTAGTGSGTATTVTVNVYAGSSAAGAPVQALSATRGSSGAWSVQASTALPVGAYTVRAEQSNALGAVAQSPAVTFNSPAVLMAAGDIAGCGGSQTGDTATASLLTANPSDAIATLGDNAYESGSATDFANCYGPTWGASAIKSKTHPSAGNHDYYDSTGDARDYFNYFGPAAGTLGQGWYSYDLGGWHVVVLNSNDGCTIVSCSVGSAQEKWLKADLAAHTNQCTLAYWHHPRFSSGANGGTVMVQAFWTDLYNAGTDVVLAGHDHDYERFAPQDPNANADSARGIREFVVGTGGYTEYEFGTNLLANSQIRNADTHGVLQLVLRPDGYSWTFLPQAGRTFTDSGSGACH